MFLLSQNRNYITGTGDMDASISLDLCLVIHLAYIVNEGSVRIQYKCLVPIYVYPKMKLRGLIISKTEL
jgi:hypothetical protein